MKRPIHAARRPVHAATVEQVSLGDFAPGVPADDAFQAVCLVSGAECDCLGFYGRPGEPPEGDAIIRALGYLGDRSLHDKGSSSFCNATHVMAHDLAGGPT